MRIKLGFTPFSCNLFLLYLWRKNSIRLDTKMWYRESSCWKKRKSFYRQYRSPVESNHETTLNQLYYYICIKYKSRNVTYILFTLNSLIIIYEHVSNNSESVNMRQSLLDGNDKHTWILLLLMNLTLVKEEEKLSKIKQS